MASRLYKYNWSVFSSYLFLCAAVICFSFILVSVAYPDMVFPGVLMLIALSLDSVALFLSFAHLLFQTDKRYPHRMTAVSIFILVMCVAFLAIIILLMASQAAVFMV